MAESTVVACPNCGKKFKISSAKLGRTFKCTGCETRFQAGAEAPAVELASPPTPPAPPMVKSNVPATAAPKVKRPAAPVAPPPVPDDEMAGDSANYESEQGDAPAFDESTAVEPPTEHAVGSTGKPKASGLAIASLVCGLILCLAPFTSLAAIILGALGLQKVKRGAGGRGMAITGIVLGVVGIILAVVSYVVLLPLIAKARLAAGHVAAGAQMKLIWRSIDSYHQKNGGEYPPDLATLWKNDPSLNGSIFVSPLSKDTPAASYSQLQAGGHLSYLYIYPGPGKTSAKVDVLLYENPLDNNSEGTSILEGDGAVEYLPMTEAQARISKSAMLKP